MSEEDTMTAAAPKTAAEREEYLVRLAKEAFTAWARAGRQWGPTLRERMAQAAQAWDREVGDAREEALETIADLTIERDKLRAQVADMNTTLRSVIDAERRDERAAVEGRTAQLEQAVERLSADLDEATQNAQAASERHAVESGEQRQTIAALAAQLVREMRRGGA